MPYRLNEFHQDLKEVIRSLDNADYAMMNILGNRITSNSYLLNGPDFAIPGFMIKDLALLLVPIKPLLVTKNLLSKASSPIKLFTNKIEKEYSSNQDLPKLWEFYLTTMHIMRKNISEEEELEIYFDENPTLTSEGVLKLIKLMSDNRMNLTISNGRVSMILSTITEINRLFMAYGMNLEIAKLRLVLIVLGQIHNYIDIRPYENSLNTEDRDMIVSFITKKSK
jgi:hypothetical protein